jgi:hypothetical protein
MKVFPALSAVAALLATCILISGAAGAQVAPASPAAPMSAVPSPSATSAPTPAVLTVGEVPVAVMGSAAQADGQAWVSLARLSLETCGPVGSQPPAAVQQQYTGALADYLAHRYARAIATSNTIVNTCTATQQQSVASPTPSS